MAAEACWTVGQLQELLDEWIVCWQNRPHEGLRHPVLPKAALTPNEMWGAVVGVCGYVPQPLTGRDYLELLPVRWQAITERGIRIDYRTYDAACLNEHRGQPSGITSRSGKWEVHVNPHDLRQVWVRLPDGELTEVPWIHRDHVHSPFNDRIWRHIQATVARRADREGHEADLADALDHLLRRARTSPAPMAPGSTATPARTGPPSADGHRESSSGMADAATADPDAAAAARSGKAPGPDGAAPASQGGHSAPGPDQTRTGWEEGESIDDLEHIHESDDELSGDGPQGEPAPAPGTFALYDAYQEAEQW